MATIDRLVPDQLQKYFPDLIAIELPSWFDRTRWTTRARPATARRGGGPIFFPLATLLVSLLVLVESIS